MPRFVAALLLLAVLSHAPRAQQAAPPWQPKLDAWVAAVETHVPGRADAAAATIAQWLNSDISRMTPHIETLLQLLLTPPLDEARILRGANGADVQFLRDIAKRVERTMD